MKSIIFYPENNRDELKRIFNIFNSQKLKVDASKINPVWTLDNIYLLCSALKDYSHICLIISPEVIKEHWFLSLIGYISGSNIECFFYFTQESNKYLKVLSKFPHGEDYDAVSTYLKHEKVRWEESKVKDDSRNHLIEQGYALSQDSFGECVVSGDLELAKKYIYAGYSCSSKNSKGVSVLCLAVRNNHLGLVEYLINAGADIDSVSDDRHNSALMDAASSGHLDSVKLLVEQGANLEFQSKNGQTALVLAVGNGDVETSVLLLDSGADYEVKDQLGMSALSYAKLFNKKEILDKMV